MKAIEALTSVLCDPEGKCCISGSDDDRLLIDSALAELAANAADRAIEGCPELNMGNYDEVGVERLNDWAIRANDEIGRLHALAAGQATAAQTDSVQEDAARYQWIRGPVEESTRYSRWRIEYWDGPNGWQPMQRERMDAAIDAARAQAAQPEGGANANR